MDRERERENECEREREGNTESKHQILSFSIIANIMSSYILLV